MVDVVEYGTQNSIQEVTQCISFLPEMQSNIKQQEQRFGSEQERLLKQIYRTRQPFPERGIEISSPFKESIRALGWEKLCATPGMINLSVRSEFYANLRCGTTWDEALCRGKIVQLTLESVNELYGLPNVPFDEDEYLAFHYQTADGWDFDEATAKDIVRTVSRLGIDVDSPVKPGWSKILKKHLTPKMNGWYHFGASKIDPVKMNIEVHSMRLMHPYTTKKKLKWNVGRKMVRSLKGCYGFCSLISELCTKVGVPHYLHEIYGQPMMNITLDYFKKMAPDNVGPSLESRVSALEEGVKNLLTESRYQRSWFDHMGKVFEYQLFGWGGESRFFSFSRISITNIGIDFLPQMKSHQDT